MDGRMEGVNKVDMTHKEQAQCVQNESGMLVYIAVGISGIGREHRTSISDGAESRLHSGPKHLR